MSTVTAQSGWPRRAARRDAWWVQPLLVFLGLSTFLVYSTWAAFQNSHYTYGPYLSPFLFARLFSDARPLQLVWTQPGSGPRGCRFLLRS